ncbi:putative transposase [Colletotrichum chrysophilum]|uniref:Transposase n=1 Tax=Colletotrichum chrysophilum TaxID=1836956 RepID=A0AAD9E6T4_9PEZI|nr:putative transposase [Colletotrichum chrysophilum]
MSSSSNESRIILAIEAIKKDPKLSVRKAASIYKVLRTILRNQRAGLLLRRETHTNLMMMT